MQRLVYVSKHCIELPDVETVVAQIVAHAHAKNIETDITGALVFTGEHFAQVLEGSPKAVSKLMADIQNDDRHCNVVVVDIMPIKHRMFADWRMAYQGPSPFVARQLAKLQQAILDPEKRDVVDSLTEMAHEFSLTS